MAVILIVDDSNYTRRSHRRIIESDGHTVHEATSGMAAIESFFVHRPDLVLLDLTMEDIGGLEVLEKLRELNAGARVVVISADVQKSTGELVAQSGALRFLGKPASPEDLVRTVREVLAEGPDEHR
jgi:two-component system, chemotaxis family, chemotaxis protein CheY